MPHVFPRRFLRTRDVLDPSEFNEDIHPVYDLIQGRLDRSNFNAGNLKTNLRNHPDSVTPETSGPSVAEGAYFKTYVSQIESQYEFYSGSAGDALPRNPPNFVEGDGGTFRGYMGFSGSNPNCYPSVVPNHGAWSAVQNEDLTGSQKLTFTTGQSKIWVSAYAQYIWQGFYEYKKPWINGSRRFRGVDDFKVPELDETWMEAASRENIATRERKVLNNTGPSSDWESLPSAHTKNTAENLKTYNVPYAFALNETEGSEDERQVPNRNGYHHISKGFKPCLLQFALRVDGKIIEETITGKRLPFEESPHGLEVTDSIRQKEADEAEQEELYEFFPGFSMIGQTFGQRSFNAQSAFGDSKDSRPGQKIRSSRAVGYGPEVLPIRLGAVVEVQPGEHTIELVVRRLQRKKGKFEPSDFVGVFSRRLLAFDLPIRPPRQPTTGVIGGTGWEPSPGSQIPGFKTEDKIDNHNLVDAREVMAAKLNSVGEKNIDRAVLTNKYLPSKVVYSSTDTIKPTLTIGSRTGEFGSTANNASTEAIFPGFKNTSYINNTVSRQNQGWSSTGDYFSSGRAGWMQLQDTSLAKLSISAPSSEQVLRPNEKIILMMDVEVRGIEPLLSKGSDFVRAYMGGSVDGNKARELFRDYGNYLLSERYLDLFALFAIGYKKDSNWVIASESVPAMVNSFNWVNRSAAFSAANAADLPIKVNQLPHKDIWDLPSGWDNISSNLDEFFLSKDEETGGYFYPGQTYARGGRLFRSNMGINLPIMQVIENNGSTDLNISEFGGFASTMVPSKWTNGWGPYNERKWTVDADFGDYTLHVSVDRAWASPMGGRDILKGARVHFGNSRLTAIKIVK